MGTNHETNEVDSTETSPRSSCSVVAGVLLLLPAIFCCGAELLVSTIRTGWLSLSKLAIGRPPPEFVGFENYGWLARDPGLGGTLAFTFLLIVVRLVVVAVVPVLLAWSLGQFRRPARLVVRVLLTAPVVLFMPVVIALVWVLALNPMDGLFSFDSPPLAGSSSARITLLLIDAVYTFALACGLGLMIYLPIWRRPDQSRPLPFKEIRKPLLATWGIGMLATVALTLPYFTLSYVMTAGGPANSTRTLGLWQYNLAFRYFRFGPAASLATLSLIFLAILGILAGLLVALTRLRFTMVSSLQRQRAGDNGAKQGGNKRLPLIALTLTLLLSLGACSLGALPYAWTLVKAIGEGGYAQITQQIPLFRTLVNTVFPPLLAAIVQLLIAYLAALSIGAVRPLGRYSQWLLLPFSPWLFVTILPLGMVNLLTALRLGIVNTFIGLVPPILFSVAALFILTLFFRGQAPHWEAAIADKEGSKAGAFFKYLILPSLPLVAVLLLFMLFSGWQSLFWPLSVSSGLQNATMSLNLALTLAQFGSNTGIIAAAATLFLVPMSLLFFVMLAILQIFYLDQLAVRAGEDLSN